MKKIFTLMLSLGILSSVFAQSRRESGQYDNGYGYNTESRYHQDAYNQDAYNTYGSRGSFDNRDHDRRDMNQDFERSTDNRFYYNDDDRFRSNGRSYMIEERREQRSDNLKAVGAGLIVGGIIALIAGSH